MFRCERLHGCCKSQPTGGLPRAEVQNRLRGAPCRTCTCPHSYCYLPVVLFAGLYGAEWQIQLPLYELSLKNNKRDFHPHECLFIRILVKHKSSATTGNCTLLRPNFSGHSPRKMNSRTRGVVSFICRTLAAATVAMYLPMSHDRGKLKNVILAYEENSKND